MACARIVGTVSGHPVNHLFRSDLVSQVRQHSCIIDTTGRDLDGADIQSLCISGDVDLAPDPALRSAVLAALSYGFSRHLGACAVDQGVQAQ